MDDISLSPGTVHGKTQWILADTHEIGRLHQRLTREQQKADRQRKEQELRARARNAKIALGLGIGIVLLAIVAASSGFWW